MKTRALLFFGIGGASAALLLSLAACKHDDAAASPKGAASAGGGRGGRGGAGLMFPVDVMDVESKTVDYIVQAPGTIDAFEQVQVTARVAGVVDKVAFTEGQVVKAGDLLVIVDAERYQLAVNSANAALNKAIATEKDSQAAADRRATADQQHPGLIPGEEVASYQTKTLTAKADTQSAQENVKIAQVNLRDSFVRAPIGGTIQTRTVATGQYVQAGYLMATLLNDNPMLLHFSVEPADAPRLKVGMTANFTMRETQRQFTAKITLVNGAADPNTHTVGVTASVDNTDHKFWLRPGSFCDVTVDVGGTRDSPVIPRTAIRPSDHGEVVYVIDGDTAKQTVITTGMHTTDGWEEVRSGLTAGQLLVVRGADALKDGVHVKASKVTSLDAGVEPVPMQLDGGHGAGGGGARPGGSGSAGGHKGKPPTGAPPSSAGNGGAAP